MTKVTLTLTFYKRGTWEPHSLCPSWEFDDLNRCLQFISNAEPRVLFMFSEVKAPEELDLCWSIERKL